MQQSTDVSDPSCQSGRVWVDEAIRRVSADANRSADTHLIPLRLPDPWAEWGIDVYLKDESTHPTGSLKHRLARSLFLYGLCNGWIREGTTIVEASSGSTAVSEAYFARMLGLPFVAVMPRSTSKEKCELIEFQGGECHFVDDPGALYEEARRVAAAAPAESGGGHYMDQFTYAERATDWRGNNNIAESIFEQMSQERHPCPRWIVVGAGTGGTSATIGRYLRYQRYGTQLCVVDPENSAFFEGWRSHDPDFVTGKGSRIEGIGRPRVEPSFQPDVVDRMIRVPDAASIAAMRTVSELSGRDAGGSTGTNFWGVVKLMCELRAVGARGSIVTLLCDGGDRYRNTYKSDAWLAEQGLDLAPHNERLHVALATGKWPD
ncbi:PLP-dependent cysteine synthase family protein [Catenulispora sp. NF23]|uniref:L-cysteine desulfhydrase Cds1 n=1 Tax=Catenulispora pinistramenti TaxID=2705254 RepID=A0ABS5KNU1_9ACTN|nr:PLP-dependent cysteine synthase family protein [Catenulispora pinistramenti]MBS2537638.1 PLP-dependent cysteine synthase family protein [Catenulispora pinistramenti]MBS2547697.1 PLP-dependent cysteine synthase family protein [Catenulispora pinistramenti]